jgi:outer membrane protein OmpA-like peptidoglycan-associated protein
MKRARALIVASLCLVLGAPQAARCAGAAGGDLSGQGSGLGGQGAGLAGAGSALSGSASGLGAFETDLGTALRLSADVLFDFDKADLKPAAIPMLERLAELIQQKKPRQVQVHGHTDSIGSDTYNLKLSQRRADAVAAWLRQHGVSADLLATKGFGAGNPIAANRGPDGADDPAGRQKNRRVDILLAKAFSAITPLGPGPRAD